MPAARKDGTTSGPYLPDHVKWLYEEGRFWRCTIETRSSFSEMPKTDTGPDFVQDILSASSFYAEQFGGASKLKSLVGYQGMQVWWGVLSGGTGLKPSKRTSRTFHDSFRPHFQLPNSSSSSLSRKGLFFSCHGTCSRYGSFDDTLLKRRHCACCAVTQQLGCSRPPCNRGRTMRNRCGVSCGTNPAYAMSSQLFDAQLLVPDNNASHLQLVDLITAGKFTGPGLPDVAHQYLDAFCNKSYSNGRRRWAGIALVHMMRASVGVVQRLKKLAQGPSRIGAIILDPSESEERRIVAGLIIRQGLEAGIDFAELWESDKVMHSAPNFPKDSSEQWMNQFQTYLDDLSNLKLTNLDTDALVLYPMSLSANDGFQWTGKSAVALIERDSLTIVVSDSTLTNFHFIDIPISHVKETCMQQDSPHESQEGRSGHKMHNLIMKLRSTSPSYRLNSSDRTASEFKTSFFRHEDAHEFDVGLQDARKNLANATTATAEAVNPTASSSSPNVKRQSTVHRIDTILPPRQREDAHHSSDTGSGGTLDGSVSSEQLREEQSSTQHAAQERGKGKLPKISKATKQKVVRTQQLPSGPFKITKAKVSKKTTPVIDASEDEDEELSEDEYNLKSTATTRSSVTSATGRKSQGRRKVNAEDEDFVLEVSTSKPKSTKRKRGSNDAAEASRPTKKKTQSKPSDNSGPTTASTTAKKQKAKAQESAQTELSQAREPMKQPTAQQKTQNGVSARHSLIGGLLKSKSPSKAAAPTFKKPGQPASTPSRQRAQPVRTTPKPQTPIETCRDLETLPVYVSSSTPRSQAIHDEDFGLHYTPVDTEILSSNTKRVPDSPHAESTAISGHADRDVVHREKWIGDLETAKSDPFQQRREGQRMTTLYRRFTGESTVDSRPDAVQEGSFSMPAEITNDDTEVDELQISFASQPLQKHSPSLAKHRTNMRNQQSIQSSPARVRGFKGPSTTVKESPKATTAALPEEARALRFEATRSTHTSQNGSNRAQREPTPEKSRPAFIGAAEKGRRVAENTLDKRAQAYDSIISAPREAVENTLPEVPAQSADQVDLDGDTTLVGEEMDLPEQYRAKASELRFRSSPPIPDSSSVRGDFSDESEPEPEPSPPTSRADELEWEAALQPHQRALHEQMLRTTKRVMRHIVDNETAVIDIADMFADDGERLLGLLLERQSNESAVVFQELASKRQDLLRELSDASKNLKAQRKQIRAIDPERLPDSGPDCGCITSCHYSTEDPLEELKQCERNFRKKEPDYSHKVRLSASLYIVPVRSGRTISRSDAEIQKWFNNRVVSVQYKKVAESILNKLKEPVNENHKAEQQAKIQAAAEAEANKRRLKRHFFDQDKGPVSQGDHNKHITIQQDPRALLKKIEAGSEGFKEGSDRLKTKLHYYQGLIPMAEMFPDLTEFLERKIGDNRARRRELREEISDIYKKLAKIRCQSE
ncbi:hypothetical protein BU25DRAFT_418948 [Macroventuria anomochaeta]|uniref:Uncharacterized protein n=1 Tax=Macroventuria anomochaeta TaxID=301207 RepID=A0ACB6S8J5_9PLEO|nr:uncharacterized protein BU25DRAFT_418948 [Macroventuria anomochaeta]KAF2630575.1 hypothetical protein BU25DRAFT_418948 [Macroventuria anomochaeta]